MEDMRGINDRHRNRRCYSCVKTRCHPAATRSIPAIGARGSSDVTAASCPVTGGRVYPFKLNAARTSAELALTFADWDLEGFRDYFAASGYHYTYYIFGYHSNQGTLHREC